MNCTTVCCAGVYTMIAMMFAAVSVLASIISLNIAHLPSKRQPGRKMRRVFHLLCRFAFMTNVYAQNDVAISTSQIMPLSETKSPATFTSADGEVADYSEEYTFYSLVLDRALFSVLLFSNLVVIIIMLIIYPLFSVPNYDFVDRI